MQINCRPTVTMHVSVMVPYNCCISWGAPIFTDFGDLGDAYRCAKFHAPGRLVGGGRNF